MVVSAYPSHVVLQIKCNQTCFAVVLILKILRLRNKLAWDFFGGVIFWSRDFLGLLESLEIFWGFDFLPPLDHPHHLNPEYPRGYGCTKILLNY